MTTAGVELPDGRRIWVGACGVNHLRPLDRVLVRRGGVELQGIVFLVPTDLIAGDPGGDGVILSVIEPMSRGIDKVLPGADMPTLGSLAQYQGGLHEISAIDPVDRTVTLGTADEQVTVLVSEIGGGDDD